MVTQKFESISKALAHLAVIRQATSDTEIQTVCSEAASTIASEVDDIIITEGTDPAAELSTISSNPFYSAIDECNAIADGSNSTEVKESCKAIVQALTAVIKKLI